MNTRDLIPPSRAPDLQALILFPSPSPSPVLDDFSRRASANSQFDHRARFSLDPSSRRPSSPPDLDKLDKTSPSRQATTSPSIVWLSPSVSRLQLQLFLYIFFLSFALQSRRLVATTRSIKSTAISDFALCIDECAAVSPSQPASAQLLHLHLQFSSAHGDNSPLVITAYLPGLAKLLLESIQVNIRLLCPSAGSTVRRTVERRKFVFIKSAVELPVAFPDSAPNPRQTRKVAPGPTEYPRPRHR